MKRWIKNRRLRIGVELLIVAALILGVRAYMMRHLASGPAPQFVAVDLQGRAHSLADTQGKPVLLHFWATWCSICRAEQDSIDAIAKDHVVVTVATQSGEVEEIRDYMREHGLRFRVLMDLDGAIARRYGVRGVPATFVLDADGDIRFTEVGYTTEWGMRARLWLAGW